MQTEIFEADPFTSRKSNTITTIDSDYRFEKGDEFLVERDGRTSTWRVIQVRVILSSNSLRREVAAMRI